MLLNFRNYSFFTAVFILFTVVFYTNFFGRLDGDFKNFQRDSESLIIGRLALSEREGVFYENGLPGCYKDYLTDQYRIFEDGIYADKEDFDTYNSQNGGQGILFSILNKISPFSNSENLVGFYMITATLLALFFTLFLFWVRSKYGFLTVLISLCLLLLSDWIIVFSRNLWWSLWSFYLPFIFMLLFLNKRIFRLTQNISYSKQIYLWSFLLVFIKCLITGFEYITTTLIMSITPFVYYALLDRWSLKIFINRLLFSSMGFLTGILGSVCLLIFQLIGKKNLEAANGFIYLKDTFFRRTYANSSSFSTPYKESLDSSVWAVLDQYLSGNAFIFNKANDSIAISFLEVIFVFAGFSLLFLILLFFNRLNSSQKTKGLALMYTMWFTISAPLSWFVIFKSHSYIHTHMNFIVWYMPFMLLGFVWIGYVISCIISGFLRKVKLYKNKALTT
ncbi:hypothetical protein [Flavobacterium sp. HSC-61S13]|uniref:hypothetical protein n=1 Tax=Flavobacterium sp. HSC-61S13 TaxID=2910963 RepID=UPI00209C9A5B|nr:hypothetical protein [Flavobacterium sp. HSC-61S13]MCP1997198.1 hypothetical protein [Flavobacterium sp. HSC-61S13]